MKHTKEKLESAVAVSSSVAGVLRELELKQSGGNHSHISQKIRGYGIDTSHFTGQGHNSGGAAPNKLHYSEVLIKNRYNGRRTAAHRLRRALEESGRPFRCVDCPTEDTWMGRPLTLEVNHKNGDFTDNRPDNLEFLCPNCHSQKPNHSHPGSPTARGV